MQLNVRLGRSLLLALLFAVLVPLAAQARSSGIARQDGCNNCHARNASGSVTVSVSGPATLLLGEVATYTLTMTPLLEGGSFYVEPDVGSVAALDPNTTTMNGGVSHSAANVGDWSYDFSVTAPGTLGTITLAFAGLVFDGDGSANDADIWNVGTYLVSVVPEPATGLLVGLGIGMLAVAGRRRNA